jgi:sulfane dehydrogenase subunit SoxC
MSNYRKIQAEDCRCREGMFPRGKVSRRGLLFAVGSTVGVSSASLVRPALAAALSAPPGSIHYDVAADPTKEQGRPIFEDGGYGSRSQFETAVRLLAPNPNPNTTFTPLADLLGNITPSDQPWRSASRYQAVISNRPKAHEV